MTNEVLHVKSRCGGGKTKHTIEHLYPFITQNPDETVIFSSITKKLTTQSYEAFESISRNISGPQPPLQRIDSDTVPASSTVLRELHKRLDRNEGGVIFTSHAILQTVDASRMRDVRLIIDEVPAKLVKHLHVHYEYKDNGSGWEKLIKTEPCPDTQYKKATLDLSCSSREDVQRRIDNVRSGVDNSVTTEVADLLEFLLTGHEVTYTNSRSNNGKVINHYLATDWKRLEDLVINSKRMAILSSQVQDTLIGFVLEKVMNIPITPTSIDPTISLEDVHDVQAVIYPLLEQDRWSGNLKKKPANERLTLHGKLVASTQLIGLYAQEIAQTILQGQPTLFILNNKEDQHECWQNYPCKSITSSSHGQNDHTDYHHAAFLASNRPNQYETDALKLFANDHGLSKDEIIQTVLKERCHEAAYQCIARTSVRNPNTGLDTKHIFIVPDEAHAAYLETWFTPGMAKIDRSYLHRLQSTSASKTKDKKMFNLLVRIRTDYLAKKGKLKELKKQYGIDERTYTRNIEKFRPELEKAGLIKQKRIMTAKPVT
jgi:hypothetical protein